MDLNNIVGYGWSAETALLSLNSCLIFNLGHGLQKSRDNGKYWFISGKQQYEAIYVSKNDHYKFFVRLSIK